MLITMRKKNILLVLVGILSFSFLFINFVSNKGDQYSMLESYYQELEEQNQDEDYVIDHECSGEQTNTQGELSIPTVGHPLEMETQIDVPIASNYFMEYKLERDRIRSRQIDILREIVNNPNSISENRMEAQQRLFTLSDNLERELELENLLAAKGFDHTAVLIQPTAVTIVVGKSKLEQEEIARISDFAVKTTGYKLENVVIVPLQQNTDEKK